MRLLLIQPKPPYDVFRRSVVSAPVCPPLTLATLGAAARAAGHDVRLLDLSLENDVALVIRQTVAAFRPDAVGVTFYTMLAPQAYAAAALLRELLPHVLLIAGGVHPTVLPEEALTSGTFDVIVMGEGEHTLVELLAGRARAEIAGLAYRDGEPVVRTAAREPLADLDSLPRPAYDLFDLDRYDIKTTLWRQSRVVMSESSRGCPFGCCFCASSQVFGRRWRGKSPAYMEQEINGLLDLGFREIHFQDDGFTTDLARAKEICRRIIGLSRKFPWELFNGIRVDRVDDEFLALAARAGCYRVRFGVESGNQRVLDGIGKGTQLAQIRQAFALTRRHGIEAIALFILGLPDETEETMAETTRFAIELKPDFARVSIYAPFPGTVFYERWKAEGRLLTSDWNEYQFHALRRPLYNHPHLTAGQIRRAYRRFYRRFYLRPGYWASRVVVGLRRGSLLRDLGYFWNKFVTNPALRRVKR